MKTFTYRSTFLYDSIACDDDYLWARIFKRLWSPGIDSKEWTPPAYVAWRAGTITLFLAPIGCLKIPALLKDLTIMEITKYLKFRDL